MVSAKEKSFRLPIWSGILEHHKRMGDAIWLFIWCIDKTTKERTTEGGERLGAILRGAPIRDGDIAQSIPGSSRKLVRKWRQRLVAGGYLIQKRTPYGHILEVYKSKKWPTKEPGELPKRVTLPEERTTQTGTETYPNGHREVPERVQTKKTLQDSINKSSQTEISKMQQEPTLTLASALWKKIGISTLPESFAPFVELAESIKPKREALAPWGQRVLAACKKRNVRFPSYFLKVVKDAERAKDNRPLVPIPPGSVQREIELSRKVSESLDGIEALTPEERSEWKQLRDVLGRS
jgi:hypothetical protein